MDIIINYTKRRIPDRQRGMEKREEKANNESSSKDQVGHAS